MIHAISRHGRRMLGVLGGILFTVGSIQNHPLNKTLQQCTTTQDFPYIQPKNVDDSQAVDSDLRCSKLLGEEACFNILNKIPCIM